MEQAGALIRVSTSRQLEGRSLEKQREAATAPANERGLARADAKGAAANQEWKRPPRIMKT
jgi:DNA invertase Pin-like site-specific DNA recombinase